jgi:hypothetical protein
LLRKANDAADEVSLTFSFNNGNNNVENIDDHRPRKVASA